MHSPENAEDRISVLIVDDHAVVRYGLRSLLDLQEEIELVGEAANGHEAVEQVRQFFPDVVLMDLVMPEMDGIEATRRIRALSPSTKVVVLTSFKDDENVFSAIKAGAAGYLLKNMGPTELVTAIVAAYQGEPQLHPEVARRLMDELVLGPRHPAPGELTERELVVLRLIAQGQGNRDIAQNLVISEKTVKAHVSHILAKLHLTDRTQAAIYAIREGLASEE